MGCMVSNKNKIRYFEWTSKDENFKILDGLEYEMSRVKYIMLEYSPHYLYNSTNIKNILEDDYIKGTYFGKYIKQINKYIKSEDVNVSTNIYTNKELSKMVKLGFILIIKWNINGINYKLLY